jgi:hypothetical protein
MRHLLALALLSQLATAAPARDPDGRWAQSPYKQWFDSLTNRQGLGCCSDADGIRLDDPEWRCEHAGRCFVKLDGVWREVPPDAILDTSNIVGYAMVWRLPDGRGGIIIRCFLRGTEV